MYSADCLRTTESDIKNLSSYHNRCLGKILRLFYQQKTIQNNENNKYKDITKRWRWICHALRKLTISQVWHFDGLQKGKGGKADQEQHGAEPLIKNLKTYTLPGERWKKIVKSKEE